MSEEEPGYIQDIEIDLRSPFRNSTIKLDGKKLAVRSLRIEGDAASAPTLTVELEMNLRDENGERNRLRIDTIKGELFVSNPTA